MPKKNLISSYGPLLLIGAGVILILILILGQAISDSVAKNPGTSQTNGIQRTSMVEAKKAFDEGSAIFLDVRDKEYYSDEHIKGAVSLPLNEISARASQLDSTRWIITYCT